MSIKVIKEMIESTLTKGRMENSMIYISILIALLTALIWKRLRSSRSAKNLPPSPWKLPIIGHLHHLSFTRDLPHRTLAKLSRKHGELLYLQLGHKHTVVVSSRRLAKEVLRTQDLVFANRADILLARVVFYDAKALIFGRYGELWRQLRRICTLELLSAKRVESFGWIRKDEASKFVTSVKAHLLGQIPVNLSQKLSQYNSSMVMRAVLGDHVSEADRREFLDLVSETVSLSGAVDISDLFPCLEILQPFLSLKSRMVKLRCSLDRILDKIIDQHSARPNASSHEDLIDVILRIQRSGDLQIPITGDIIKAVMFDMFSAGTETSSTTVEWAMAELIRHPNIMGKAQSEIRRVIGGKNRTTIEETDIQDLEYLKLVVKETMRLHPVVPLLVPRESREECEVDGYKIPLKTRLMVNVWAIGRDPEYWDDPDSFKPERFENSSVDFMGNHFEFLPFGAGRRMCPGMNFGMANVFLPLALLLYHFDWELPNALNHKDLDMTEAAGMAVGRLNHLLLLPKLMI